MGVISNESICIFATERPHVSKLKIQDLLLDRINLGIELQMPMPYYTTPFRH